MKTLKTLAAAGAIASAMALAPAGAHAQTPVTTGSSFDAYRVVAVTAGVIGGAVVAAVVTDGLIIPAYVWATSSAGMAGGGMAGGAVGGAGVTGMTVEGAMAGNVGHVVRGGMRVLGAIGGGFYADSWYTGK